MIISNNIIVAAKININVKFLSPVYFITKYASLPYSINGE